MRRDRLSRVRRIVPGGSTVPGDHQHALRLQCRELQPGPGLQDELCLQEYRYGVRRGPLRSNLHGRLEVRRTGAVHDDGIVLQWRRRTLQQLRLSSLLLLLVVFLAGRGSGHLPVRAGMQRVRHGQRVPVMPMGHVMVS